MEWLLANGCGANLVDRGGSTPLHHASNVAAAALLVEAGATLDYVNDSGQTPYEAAASTYRREVADWLGARLAAAGLPVPDVALPDPLVACDEGAGLGHRDTFRPHAAALAPRNAPPFQACRARGPQCEYTRLPLPTDASAPEGLAVSAPRQRCRATPSWRLACSAGLWRWLWRKLR